MVHWKKVIDTRGVVFERPFNQGIALTKSPLAVPSRIDKGIRSVRAADANVKTYLRRFRHESTPRGLNTHLERAKPLIKVESGKNVSHEVSQAKLVLITKYLEVMAESGGFEPPIELLTL
jgi:hypothetical protein